MKKKGLIISTIVMVVVLIASLTTATYAWFTTTARAEVTAINVGVTTDAKVMIGVSKTNAFTTSTAIESNFMNGSVTFDAGSASDKWSGGQEGLGTSINTGLSMNGLTMATFSATGTGDDPTAYAIDASNAFNAAAAQWIKAPGNGTTIAENTQYQFAYANNRVVSGETVSGDYLDVTFGVRAAKANI
ncbi:MAG: hypothetical protein IJ226_03735, partial [Clostridia bacterium]|nr:hypothetical protein [Clostridia bacterium]